MVDKTTELNEFKSDDDQSEIPEPIATGDKKRPADQNNGQKAIPQFATKAEAMSAAVSAFSGLTKLQISDYLAGLDKSKNARPLDKNTQILPKGSMKEAVDEIFDGIELDENLKEKTVIVFEAALNTRLAVETARIEEEFEQKLTEAVEEIRNELTEAADQYFDDVAERWLAENELAIESQIRVELAEQFMQSMFGLLKEHSIVLPENVDVVEDLTHRLEEATEKLEQAMEVVDALSEEIDEYKVAEVFDDISEGLTLVQAEKLADLAEGIEYVNPADYARKLEVIKETYFPVAIGDTNTINETFDGEEDVETKIVDPVINSYVNATKRHIAR